MQVVRSRNVFIDSEQYHTANGEKVIVNFPANSFHVLDGEHMKLTLCAFEMRKNFYNINSYNNKFYLHTPETDLTLTLPVASATAATTAIGTVNGKTKAQLQTSFDATTLTVTIRTAAAASDISVPANNKIQVVFTAPGDPTAFDSADQTIITDTIATFAGLTPPVAGSTITLAKIGTNTEFTLTFPVADAAAVTTAVNTVNGKTKAQLQTAFDATTLVIIVDTAAVASDISVAAIYKIQVVFSALADSESFDSADQTIITDTIATFAGLSPPVAGSTITLANIDSDREIVIPVGDYYKFGVDGSTVDSLCKAIFVGMTTAGFTGLLEADVKYNINTRKLEINMSNVTANYETGEYFVTYQVPAERQSVLAGVSRTGLFNDSYEILGARPTRYIDNLTPAFSRVGNTFTSFYPASLYSMEALYLRASIQTNNYCTPTFGADTVSGKLIPTQIFARIPIPYADIFERTQDQPSIIKFEDTNDLFTIYLQQNQLDTVNFSLVDSKGRLIEEVSSKQSDDGALAFKFVMRWDVIREQQVGIPIRNLTDRVDQLFRRSGLN